jgi:hypothetical protein
VEINPLVVAVDRLEKITGVCFYPRLWILLGIEPSLPSYLKIFPEHVRHRACMG